MTIKIPTPNIWDTLLLRLGKKRGVHLPKEEYALFGQHSYLVGVKENFWRALFRSAGTPLPDGMVDIFELNCL
jgi:hypothetical protein